MIVVGSTVTAMALYASSAYSRPPSAAVSDERWKIIEEQVVGDYLSSFRSCRNGVIRKSVAEKSTFENYWRSLVQDCGEQEIKAKASVRSFIRNRVAIESSGANDEEREIEIVRRTLPVILSIEKSLEREYDRALQSQDR